MSVEMTYTEILEATKLWPPPTPSHQRRAIRQLTRFLAKKEPYAYPNEPDNSKPAEYRWARLFWRCAYSGHPSFKIEKHVADLFAYALRKNWPYALTSKQRAKKPQKTVIERRYDRTIELIKEWERKHKLAGTKLRQLKAKRVYYERELRKRAIRSDAAEFIIDHREKENEGRT